MENQCFQIPGGKKNIAAIQPTHWCHKWETKEKTPKHCDEPKTIRPWTEKTWLSVKDILKKKVAPLPPFPDIGILSLVKCYNKLRVLMATIFKGCLGVVKFLTRFFCLQALNNLQSTFQGFNHVNSENVFKVSLLALVVVKI